MILIDSSVWIDNIRNAATPQVLLLRRISIAQIIMGDLVMLEVLRGLRTHSEAARQEARFRNFGVTALSSPQIAVAAADNYRELRGRGVTIRSSIDLLIATYCLTYNHHLLHDDRDFDHFERHLRLKVLR
jgi:predicted nucleic acid-binding protein